MFTFISPSYLTHLPRPARDARLIHVHGLRALIKDGGGISTNGNTPGPDLPEYLISPSSTRPPFLVLVSLPLSLSLALWPPNAVLVPVPSRRLPSFHPITPQLSCLSRHHEQRRQARPCRDDERAFVRSSRRDVRLNLSAVPSMTTRASESAATARLTLLRR